MVDSVMEQGRAPEAAGEPAAAPVLVVDDDPAIRRVVRAGLEREGLRVRDVATGGEALEHVTNGHFSAVILDLNLAGVVGFDVLSRIRSTSAVPVIVLTGRGAEVDRVLGLELGADDYVVKPFSPRELAARVRAVVRRSARCGEGARDLLFGPLRIDVDARRVLVSGEHVALTAREFDLLLFLASSPRRVFSRAEVLEHVWGSATEWQDPATVTEHVRRLRMKLEADREHPRWIRTVRAKGYAFEP